MRLQGLMLDYGWADEMVEEFRKALEDGKAHPLYPQDSLVFRPTGWLGDTSTRLPAWRTGT